MSSTTLTWALRQEVRPAAVKLLLLVMADVANHTDGSVFLSTAYLEKATSLNRKTIFSATDRLIELGIITDTGERKGKTQQIKVYRFAMPVLEETVPKTAPLETVPKTDGKSPENGQGKSPENGTQNLVIGNLVENQDSPIVPQGGGGLFGDDKHDFPSDKLDDPQIVVEFEDRWQALCKDFSEFRPIRGHLNDGRRKKLLSLIRKEVPALYADQVKTLLNQMFSKMRISRFLRGHNDRNWIAGVDFMLNSNKFTRLMEGDYDKLGYPEGHRAGGSSAIAVASGLLERLNANKAGRDTTAASGSGNRRLTHDD